MLKDLQAGLLPTGIIVSVVLGIATIVWWLPTLVYWALKIMCVGLLGAFVVCWVGLLGSIRRRRRDGFWW
jgi:hypothetical protein